MLSIQFIINIFKDTKAIQILYFFLLVSILQILDLYLTIFLTHIFGEYLIMGMICSISLIGMFFSVSRVKYLTTQITGYCNDGIFPERYFFEIAGIYTGAILIFIPGFISDFLGFSFLIPILSLNAGKYISSKTYTDWHTVYEYMKL